MGYFNVFWRDLLGRECCRRAETLQARIERQGDWALKCTSGHDLERRFIGTVNDGFFEQLVLVPMWEGVIPDLGLCSAVLTLQVGLLGCPSRQRTGGWAAVSTCVYETQGTHAVLHSILCLSSPCVLSYSPCHRWCVVSTPWAAPGEAFPLLQCHMLRLVPLKGSHTALQPSLPYPGSMRACGPSSDQAKAGKPPGRVTSAPRKKVFFSGAKCERQGRRLSFTALS